MQLITKEKWKKHIKVKRHRTASDGSTPLTGFSTLCRNTKIWKCISILLLVDHLVIIVLFKGKNRFSDTLSQLYTASDVQCSPRVFFFWSVTSFWSTCFTSTGLDYFNEWFPTFPRMTFDNPQWRGVDFRCWLYSVCGWRKQQPQT